MTATSKILAENEVKKLATMLAPISFVFPPRKYPHKKKYVLCGVELEQARLNRYFRSGWIIEWRSEVLQTRHIYFRESEYVKYWAWLKGTFGIVQKSVKTTAYTAIVRQPRSQGLLHFQDGGWEKTLAHTVIAPAKYSTNRNMFSTLNWRLSLIVNFLLIYYYRYFRTQCPRTCGSK